MKRVLLMITLLATVFISNGQSLLKPLPRYKTNTTFQPGKFGGRATTLPGSVGTVIGNTYQGFRFDGPSVLAALPDFTIYTGVGISYERDTFSDSTQKWSTNWSVALKGYAGGQYAPGTISGVTAVGLSVSFFNKLVTIGLLYNLTTKKAQGAVGPTVNLIN